MAANKNQTKVYKFNLDGKLVAVYDSITIAARENKISTTCIANAMFGGTKYNMSHKKIWLREAMKDTIGEVLAKRKADIARDARIAAETRGRKKECIDNRVERRGNYIFIEKNLPAVERCIRCAMYNSDMECPPCDKRDRADGKEGYWRYSKPMDIDN